MFTAKKLEVKLLIDADEGGKGGYNTTDTLFFRYESVYNDFCRLNRGEQSESLGYMFETSYPDSSITPVSWNWKD
jgi:hypothetical protein